MTAALPVVIDSHLAEIATLGRRFGVQTLELFGSAATGELSSGSDIDLVVSFREMSPAEHADSYFGLLDALQDVFGCPVDLLEEGAIRNPYLRRSIDAAKRTLYSA
jgi:predicted nucleotidyltransferase